MPNKSYLCSCSGVFKLTTTIFGFAIVCLALVSWPREIVRFLVGNGELEADLTNFYMFFGVCTVSTLFSGLSILVYLLVWEWSPSLKTWIDGALSVIIGLSLVVFAVLLLLEIKSQRMEAHYLCNSDLRVPWTQSETKWLENDYVAMQKCIEKHTFNRKDICHCVAQTGLKLNINTIAGVCGLVNGMLLVLAGGLDIHYTMK